MAQALQGFSEHVAGETKISLKDEHTLEILVKDEGDIYIYIYIYLYFIYIHIYLIM